MSAKNTKLETFSLSWTNLRSAPVRSSWCYLCKDSIKLSKSTRKDMSESNKATVMKTTPFIAYSLIIHVSNEVNCKA